VSKLLMLATLVVPMLACHGAKDGKPGPEAVVERRDDTPRAPEQAKATPKDNDDDDDDDKGAVAGKQAPVKPTPPPRTTGAPRTFSFDADHADVAPTGFAFGRTGSGAEGKWIIKSEPGAPSGGNVLAQVDADSTDYRFPIAIANEPSLADLRLSVRCKPISGKVDQGCGLIFRVADTDNYYVTRANALENNVRLYHVVKGSRKQFAGWNGKVASGAWHDLRVDVKGDHFEVYFDGKKVIDATDQTFKAAGKVGVWTKADSVIYFDDLTVTPL
jgi:hypothetical protein